MDIEPSSRLSCLRHHITSDWRVFECVDAKQATCTNRLTIFEMGTVRKPEVIADRTSETSGHVVIIHCFLNNPRH